MKPGDIYITKKPIPIITGFLADRITILEEPYMSYNTEMVMCRREFNEKLAQQLGWHTNVFTDPMPTHMLEYYTLYGE